MLLSGNLQIKPTRHLVKFGSDGINSFFYFNLINCGNGGSVVAYKFSINKCNCSHNLTSRVLFTSIAFFFLSLIVNYYLIHLIFSLSRFFYLFNNYLYIYLYVYNVHVVITSKALVYFVLKMQNCFIIIISKQITD